MAEVEKVLWVCQGCNKKFRAPLSQRQYNCPNCKTPLKLAQEEENELIGKKIGGCEILELLGKGAMGMVYKAKHVGLNKIMAVKVLSAKNRNMELVNRMIQEARAVAKIEHPNIVMVHNVGVEGDTCFVVMDLLKGKTITRIVEEYGVLPLDTLSRLMKDIARGLGEAHKIGIIHRDLKPENVIVTENFVPKVMDFGLALDIAEAKEGEGKLVAGTPFYMPPEQWLAKGVDARSDLYALGVIFYYMATQVKPFAGEDIGESMDKHLNYDPPPPSQVNKNIPERLAVIIKKLIAKAPAKRYQTAADLIRDLERVERGLEPYAMQEFGQMVTCGFCETANPVAATTCKVCNKALKEDELKVGSMLKLQLRKSEVECPKCTKIFRKGRNPCPFCKMPFCKVCLIKLAEKDNMCTTCAADIASGKIKKPVATSPLKKRRPYRRLF